LETSADDHNPSFVLLCPARPCPGMNTLANHGYLPRSGIVTFLDLIKGQKEGYNIDYDLGAALAAIAVSLDGDLLSTKVRW
jgi:hypothetical protein